MSTDKANAVDLDQKLELEHQWHESGDFARDRNSLIVGVYASGVFDEAEAWHLAALGDVAGRHVLDYGCGTGGTTAHLLAHGARHRLRHLGGSAAGGAPACARGRPAVVRG